MENKRNDAINDVKLYMANDWEIDYETPEFFMLKKRTDSLSKHIVLFLLTWWLLCIPNLIYYLISKKKKKIIK